MTSVEKQALFDGFATVGKALASGRRVELVDVLAQGERSVRSLAAEIGQSVANTSQHLQVLAGAGLVASRREGNHVRYRLAGEAVEALWASMRAVATAHVAGADRLAEAYLGDRDEIDVVTRDALAARLGDDLLLWDVRPAEEFAAGHLPGAISVPPEAVEGALDSVPADAAVIAYCRGPFCAYADAAVRTLLAAGRQAARLEDGFPEWRRAGLPVSMGEAA